MFSANAELKELHCQDVRRSMLLLLWIGKGIYTIKHSQGKNDTESKSLIFLVFKNIAEHCAFKEAAFNFFSWEINIHI